VLRFSPSTAVVAPPPPPHTSQGCINNTTAGRQTVTFKFPGAVVPPPSVAPGYEVHVCGSFTDWQVTIPLALGPDGDYEAKVALTVRHKHFVLFLGGGGMLKSLRNCAVRVSLRSSWVSWGLTGTMRRRWHSR
jgi:hypothetical protein